MSVSRNEQIVACHEAGHAVATIVVGLTPGSIDLAEYATTLGRARLHIPSAQLEASREEGWLRRRLGMRLILVYLAGPCTQEALTDSLGAGWPGDLRQAEDIANEVCTEGYIGHDYMDPSAQRRAIDALIVHVLARTRRLVRATRFQRAVSVIAQEAIATTIVTGGRVLELACQALARTDRPLPLRPGRDE